MGKLRGTGVTVTALSLGVANRVSASLAQVAPRSLLVPILAKGHPGLQ
jgi:hypothetical protein